MPLRIDPKKINPQMIILGRESRGIAQSELADLLSIKQASMSKIENGLLKMSKDDLKKMSQVLTYPEHFFLQNEPIYGMEASDFFHRKRQNVPLKDIKKVHGILNVLTINIGKLLKSVDLGDIDIPSFDINSYDSVSEIAQVTRAVLKLPHGPIQNVISVIENAGGIVVYYDFGSNKVDAISRRIPGFPPLFFVNKSMPSDRIRMNLCHELGHIVMHYLPNSDMEEQAFEFASEFLMPAEEIGPSLENLTLQKLADLKVYWKVSMASIIYRAKFLNKITSNQERYLYSQLAKYGYKTREPINLDPPEETPRLFNDILDIHFNDFSYSKEQLCDVLALNEDEFDENYLFKGKRLKIVK